MARHDEQLCEDQYSHAMDMKGRTSPLSSSSSYSKAGAATDGGAEMPAMAAVMSSVTVQSPAAKRRAASEFVQHVTGVFIPFASDQTFRAALKDGVLLCKLLNSIWHGQQCQYLDAYEVEASTEGLLHQRQHNVTAFLAALDEQLPYLPAECRFSIADLEAEGSDERPQVANCLVYISTACQQVPPVLDQYPATPPTAPRSSSSLGGKQQNGATPLQLQGLNSVHMSYMTPNAALMGPLPHAYTVTGSYGGYSGSSPGMLQHRPSPVYHQNGMAVLHSPLMDGQSNLSIGGHHIQHSQHQHPGTLAAAHHGHSLVPMRSSQYGSPITAATHKSVQAAAGVTKLMQQCTTMLKERMGMGFSMEGGSGGSRYNGSPGPDSAMKALGPVLEGVLGQLTEEYEKRLLSKDNALGRMSDDKLRAEKEATRCKEELALVQEELTQLRDELDTAKAAAAQAAIQESAAGMQAKQQQIADLEDEVADYKRRLEAAEASIGTADTELRNALLRSDLECRRLREELDGLQDIYERYKRLIEENKTLYNTVQDLRGNIRVFCRIRPPVATGDLSPCCVDVGLEGDLAIYDQQNGAKRVYRVDRIFDQSCNQAAVYEDTQPLIRSVLDGYNVCIFAYGQTGSGKTHTMSGTDTMHEEGRGINYRALNDLFAIRDARAHEVDYQFRVQMLEIYNENLRDLLTDGRCYSGNKLDILATQASGCNVPGATQIEVSDAVDVSTLMAKGASQRATSETKMNDRSSRSHQILTVIVDGVHHVTKARTHGCLHLIDLAGSERVGKSEASGDRLVEAQHINKSLSALGDVMAALASKDRHIPYRNSKLTQLLQDSLQGQAKVMMFMHISPEANMFGESVSTLKFASRVSEITLGQAKKNVVNGKAFEAHEEALKYQRMAEQATQQAQQAQADRHQLQLAVDQIQLAYDQQAQLVELLQQQIQSSGQVPATLPAASSKQRSLMPQLPIQQMLAAQAAEAEATAAPPAATLSRSRSRGLISINAEQVGLGGSPASNSRASGRPRVDMTPTRDQDESLMTARSQAEGCGLSSVEATPRPTPRRASINSSSIPLPPREHHSAQKHLERLQSARQSGMYRAASINTASSTFSLRQLGESPSSSNLKAEASKLTGSMTARGTGVVSSSRSSGRTEATVPLTSRVSAVIKSRVAELPPSGTISMRQGGVYRPGSVATGGAAATQRATSAATSRSGSRWK